MGLGKELIYSEFEKIDKQYNIIYADPPSRYRVYEATPYPTMSLEEICNLRIQDICAENCYLFLWAQLPNIEEALTIIDDWGFTYKTTAFVWVKRNKKADSWFWGNGYYTRSNAEVCLLGTKGKLPVLRHDIHQIIDTRIEEHSKKPAIVREKIVQLLGDLPRIELFARQEAEGWDCWSIDMKKATTCITDIAAPFVAP